ncbi:MAG: CRISPR-associated endonuclease Cas2 [Candidatus Doudnabacteria bacterium]
MNNKELAYEIAVEMFAMAEDLGLLIEDIVFTPYGKLKIHRIPRTTYYRRLERFEKNGLVTKVRKHDGSAYILTDKAKKLRQKPLVKMNRTDGQSTIIMFDIPEEKHRARDNFRRYLIRHGYTQIQKSVFISPFQIFDELKEFAEELKIDSNISIVAGKIEQF